MKKRFSLLFLLLFVFSTIYSQIKIKELPGCISVGDTLVEANVMILDAEKEWIRASIEQGNEIAI